MNRWHRIVVRVLVVAQLLAAAPLASALPVASSADAMPCAEMMDMATMPADGGECPCCPEGTDSVAACLAACAAAVGITPSLCISLAHTDTPAAAPPIVVALSRDYDPPTKPPPIA